MNLAQTTFCQLRRSDIFVENLSNHDPKLRRSGIVCGVSKSRPIAPNRAQSRLIKGFTPPGGYPINFAPSHLCDFALNPVLPGCKTGMSKSQPNKPKQTNTNLNKPFAPPGGEGGVDKITNLNHGRANLPVGLGRAALAPSHLRAFALIPSAFALNPGGQH